MSGYPPRHGSQNEKSSKKRSRSSKSGGKQRSGPYMLEAAPAPSRGSRSGVRPSETTDVTDLQYMNTKGSRSFNVNRTTNIVNIAALGNVGAVYNPSTTVSPLQSTMTALFTKMKVNWIKAIFTLTTLETADDDVMPIVYIRYNNDPDLSAAAFTQTYFAALPGTVKKTFTSTSNRLEYKIYPKVMTAGLQAPAGTWMPMPRAAGWIDGTQDVALYGFQYYVAPMNAGQVMQLALEWDVTWKDPK